MEKKKSSVTGALISDSRTRATPKPERHGKTGSWRPIHLIINIPEVKLNIVIEPRDHLWRRYTGTTVDRAVVVRCQFITVIPCLFVAQGVSYKRTRIISSPPSSASPLANNQQRSFLGPIHFTVLNLPWTTYRTTENKSTPCTRPRETPRKKNRRPRAGLHQKNKRLIVRERAFPLIGPKDGFCVSVCAVLFCVRARDWARVQCNYKHPDYDMTTFSEIRHFLLILLFLWSFYPGRIRCQDDSLAGSFLSGNYSSLHFGQPSSTSLPKITKLLMIIFLYNPLTSLSSQVKNSPKYYSSFYIVLISALSSEKTNRTQQRA